MSVVVLSVQQVPAQNYWSLSQIPMKKIINSIEAADSRRHTWLVNSALLFVGSRILFLGLFPRRKPNFLFNNSSVLSQSESTKFVPEPFRARERKVAFWSELWLEMESLFFMSLGVSWM